MCSRRYRLTWAAVLLAAALLPGRETPARGLTLLTQEAALQQAFPGLQPERKVHALSGEQHARIKELTGDKVEDSAVFAYEAYREGKLEGTAYFDAHRIHTLTETLMIVVNPDGTLRTITVLAFNEPPKYMAPEGWMQQFAGKTPSKDLKLKREIDGISGATLTARAVTKAARRVLAIHRVLSQPVAHE